MTLDLLLRALRKCEREKHMDEATCRLIYGTTDDDQLSKVAAGMATKLVRHLAICRLRKRQRLADRIARRIVEMFEELEGNRDDWMKEYIRRYGLEVKK